MSEEDVMKASIAKLLRPSRSLQGSIIFIERSAVRVVLATPTQSNSTKEIAMFKFSRNLPRPRSISSTSANFQGLLAVGTLFFGMAQAFTGTAHAVPAADKPAPAAAAGRATVNYGKLPLSFEPNRGQTSPAVQWLARGPQYTLYLVGNDAVLQMNKVVPGERASSDPAKLTSTITSSAMRMSLLGAASSLPSAGEDPQTGKANYFTGNEPTKWQHDVPMFGKVRMQAVYPGVDLVYYGQQGQLEYDFVVAPGADASVIRLSFDGAKPTLAANGDLVLPVEGGPEVRFNKPVVYQTVDGVRQPVEGSFVIAANKPGRQVGIQLGAYDHSRELVIDPTFLFVGVLGTGNYETQANGMAVDAAGEIILTGLTGDVDFPVTSGAFQTVCNTYSAVAAANHWVRCGSEVYNGSAFVSKISADGTSLVYSTYLHGLSGDEIGQAVATDAAGDAIVLGQTGSYDFPITSDAIQSLCMPYYQPIGVTGGSPSDFYPIGQHCDGYYAGGGTEWVSGGPTLFIAKLNPTGSALLYSTFFGGTNPTYPSALALDSSGNIYFTSYLQGAEEYLSGGVPVLNVYPQNGTVPFPVTSSAFQTANLAQQVATLSELSADGQTLLYSTLLGSTYNQSPQWIQPLSLAVGPNGIAYVGGWTYSDSVPTTTGSVRPACVDGSVYNGGNEYGNCEAYTGWLAAFDTTKTGSTSLKYATYIGGPEVPGSNNPQQQVLGLAADSANNVYVTGLTTSPTYPITAGAFSTTCTNPPSSVGGQCNNTAFLTKINPAGTANVWSTFFSGNQYSSGYGNAIGFDAKERVYLYGWDQNYTYDLPFLNPLEPRPGNGSSYAFVATFTPDGTKLLFATPLGNQSPNAGNVYTVGNNGMAIDADGNIYFSAYGADSGTWNTSTATSGTYATTALGGSNRTYFGKISAVRDPTTTTLTFSPSAPGNGQPVTFTATVAGTAVTTPAPTGSVTLANTSTTTPTTLGTITLGANGSGTFTTSSLPEGSLSVTATYSGDSNYDVSASPAQSLAIGPAITTQPVNQTVKLGSAATFTVVATGVPTLTYQWQYLSGSTWKVFGAGTGSSTATLTTAATTAPWDGLQFRVLVTDGNSASTASNTVKLRIAPAIGTQPISQTVPDGSNATFTAAAVGVGTLSYEWEYLSGATWKSFGTGTGYNTPTLTILATPAANDEQIRLEVISSNGTATASNIVGLKVSPAIATQPVSQTVTDGSTATFSVAAKGVGALTYQWQYLSGANWKIFGAGTGSTTATLTTIATAAAFNGLQFRVVVTDANGLTATSNTVKLTIAPAITAQPASQTANVGSTATFSVTAKGVATLTYQWQYLSGTTWKAFGAGTGSTTATLTTVPTTAGFSGLQFRVVVTDGDGLTVTSNSATLTVN